MATTKPSIGDLKSAMEKAQADYAAAMAAETKARQDAAYGAIAERLNGIGEHVEAVTGAVTNRDPAGVATTMAQLSTFVADLQKVVRETFGGPRRPTSDGNGNGGTRSGGLRELVEAELKANPSTEYTGSTMGKALDRSSGACANALEKLAELGTAVQTSEKPRRYRLA